MLTRGQSSLADSFSSVAADARLGQRPVLRAAPSEFIGGGGVLSAPGMSNN